MPVTQTIQSSTFTASTGQSATLAFAVPAGKYNRGVNGFTAASTSAAGSGLQVDGARSVQSITFDYTVATPNSSTGGTITLPLQVDAVGGQSTPYSFTFGDRQDGVTLPNTLVLPDDFYRDLVGGCTVTLTLTPGDCTSDAGQSSYGLVSSAVSAGFGYLPTTAQLLGSPTGNSSACTDAPSEQALHFTDVIAYYLGDSGAAGYRAHYPPYTFEWGPGASADGTVRAALQGHREAVTGFDAYGVLETSAATYAVTRQDPGVNQYGGANFAPDRPWSGTLTVTDSDFVPNVFRVQIGDTPARPCTLGAEITVGPPAPAFAQYGRLAYTARATGGFVPPLAFFWGVTYRDREGNTVNGEYSSYDGSVVTDGDSQTIIFAGFSPPPGFGYSGPVSVTCAVQDGDRFGPCSHLALASPDSAYAPPAAPAAATSGFLAQDAHRRPLAALANPAGSGTGALGFYSNDAGHSFVSTVLDDDPTCADNNLVVDVNQNTFSALYVKGAGGQTALYSIFGSLVDGFAASAGPAEIPGLSGTSPIAAPHPTERGLVLMLLASGGSLVAVQSADYGRTWTAAGVVASGVDLSSSGRPGLAWLGETAFALYALGTALVCAQSPDRGETWAAATSVPGAVASAGPYGGVSLLGWQGTLYALAFAGSPPAPVLLRSGGGAWIPAAGALPAIAPPSAVGVLPQTGQLRLGLSHHSPDDGQTWPAN